MADGNSGVVGSDGARASCGSDAPARRLGHRRNAARWCGRQVLRSAACSVPQLPARPERRDLASGGSARCAPVMSESDKPLREQLNRTLRGCTSIKPTPSPFLMAEASEIDPSRSSPRSRMWWLTFGRTLLLTSRLDGATEPFRRPGLASAARSPALGLPARARWPRRRPLRSLGRGGWRSGTSWRGRSRRTSKSPPPARRS